GGGGGGGGGRGGGGGGGRRGGPGRVDGRVDHEEGAGAELPAARERLAAQPLAPLVEVRALQQVLHGVERLPPANAEPAGEERDLVVPEHELAAPRLHALADQGERAVALRAAVHQVAHAPRLEPRA